MVLVDSSAWIHCFRPEGDVSIRDHVQTALETGEAVWCDMVKLELWNGARGDKEKRVLRELESAVPLLACTLEVWEEAYRIARTIREKGQTVPATDLLIFACARVHRATILHADRHLDWLARHVKA
ncbi:MAG: PIN domain-containing protein [bacterium]